MDSFQADWDRWHAENRQVDPHYDGPTWDEASPVLDSFFQLMSANGNSSLTDWDEDALDATLDTLRIGLDPRTNLVYQQMTIAFLIVLVESDRWRGSDEQAQAHLARLVRDLPVQPLQPVQVDDDEQLRALLDLPMIDDLHSLLTWLGDGRKVTGTGAIRVADLPEVGSLLGLRVTTGKHTPAPETPGQLRLVTDELIPDHTSIRALPDDAAVYTGVKSMWELEQVAVAWVTLQLCELIDVGKTRAGRTQRAEPFPDDADLTLLATTVATYVCVWLGHHLDEGSILDEIDGTVAYQAFRHAIEGDPLGPDDLQDVIADEFEGHPLLANTGRTLEGRALAALRSWCDRGLLVETSEGFEVPDALQITVATAITMLEASR